MNSAPAPAPLGKRETRKQERRAAIVAAARKSFLEDGYAATSMSGLLTTLGGSKATLWSYFRSKEELFAAVIEDLTQAFREQLEGELLAAGDLRATIVLFCRSFMDRTTNPDALATWRLVVSESGRSPEVGRIFYERAPHHLEQLLAGYLDRQVAAGLLRDEGTLPMAQLLISMCVAHQTRLLLGVETAASDRAADTFADYFLRLFSL
ncbi:TetR/AcrR family transcriptional regulator [Sphingomonas sp. M1A8_2b]